MISNVGTFDRIARIVLGLALIVLLFAVDGGARWIGLLGFVLVGTAIFRFCPLYAMLGMSTCQTAQQK